MPSPPAATITRLRVILPVDGRLYGPGRFTSPDKNNNLQIRPTNLITGVYWFDKVKGRPVFTWQMQTAFFEGRDGEDWKYRPEIVKAFADKGVVPPGVDPTHQKVRSAAIVLPPDVPFTEGAREALIARPAVAPASV